MNHHAIPGPLMLDLKGLSLDRDEQGLLQHSAIGGVILFARNYESRAQLRALITAIRETRPELIIAVDQEGGRVQRFREDFTRLPSMRQLGEVYRNNAESGINLARDVGWLMAAELLCEDVDISFAPVLDIDFDIATVIGDRSFSGDKHTIIQLGDALMQGMHEAGMATTGKHFPGHGGVEADSHIAVPVDERSLEALRDSDMAVFKSLSDRMDAVMPAHVIYPQVDDKPAGFSSKWLGMLREECGFEGVIFSDDLSMEGASVAGGFAERAAAAFDAGCDMVLVCNHPEGAKQVLQHLEASPVPLNKKLLAMKHTSHVPGSWQALQDDTRWQSTVAALKALMSN